MRFCDDVGFAFGWMDDDVLRRTSHALSDGDGVWLVDPIDWPDALARAHELGTVRGVVQLLDRHERDAPAIAQRLGVPLHRVQRDAIAGTSLSFLSIVETRFWDEVALWSAEHRTLVAGDALGTVGYFLAPPDPLGVHPFLRLWPPRSLRRVYPEHVLVGHGHGVHERASDALHHALRTSRRRLPRALVSSVRRR